MINFTNGDIFFTETESILRPTSADGVLTSTLGRQYCELYPEIFPRFQKLNMAAKSTPLRPILGDVYYDLIKDKPPVTSIVTYIYKKKWEGRIPEYYLTLGLGNLHKIIVENKIKSISIPSFACGKGVGFSWGTMKAIMKDWERLYKEDLKDIDIRVYAPLKISECRGLNSIKKNAILKTESLLGTNSEEEE